MKKKFMFFTLALALAASFTSCNNENDPTVVGADGEAKTKMTITIPQVKTYADANATVNEVAFVNADVFIYNGVALLTHVTLPKSDFTATTDGWKVNSGIETTTGARRILVGLNLSADVRNSILSSSPSGVATVTAAMLADQTNGFAMFSKNILSNTNFTVTEDEATNNFKIEVERLTAKVTVRKADAMNTEATKIKVTALSFAMGNVNTKMFPLQAIDGLGVIKDPNWTSAPGSIPYSVDFVNEFGTNLAINAAAYTALDVENTTVLERKAKYVVENTSELYRQGEITFSSIRANFYPTKLASFNNTTKVLTETDNTAVVASMYAVETSAGEFFYFTTKENADEYAANYVTVNGNGTAKVSNEYKNGLCYYFNWLDAKDAKNTYATLRNHYYDMKVTKLNSIGYPDPEVPDPLDPVSTKTKLTVEVTISDWTMVSSDESLGLI